MQLLKCLSIFFVLATSGCTSISSTSMTGLSSAYREVIEQYNNENILLNIVRSSKNMPMSFLDIPSVIGTGNVLANANASAVRNMGITDQPDSIFSGSLGLAVNNGFTFTQASLDNAEFMKTFMKIIPLNVVSFRGTQQLLPRAVSYTLLIESIELQSRGNVVSRFENDPNNPNYSNFQDLLYLLIEAGLTVETTPQKTPIGPPLTRSEISSTFERFGQPLVTGLTTGGIVIDKLPNSNPETFQMNRVEDKTKMCVNHARAREIFGELLTQSAFCIDSPKYQRPDNKEFRKIVNNFTKNFPQQKDMTLVITLRSAGNVFNFLGRVVQEQMNSNQTKMLYLTPENGVLDPYNQRYYTPQPLFKVHKNSNLKNAVASVTYKGDTYQIEDEDQSYTKPVLEFMSSLLTISKIPGAIPASPAVIVR